MKTDDLDLVYTELCMAMARIGEKQAPLFLAMVSLALLARQDHPQLALEVIAQAEAASDPQNGHDPE